MENKISKQDTEMLTFLILIRIFKTLFLTLKAILKMYLSFIVTTRQISG